MDKRRKKGLIHMKIHAEMQGTWMKMMTSWKLSSQRRRIRGAF
jgi:hypothetical protein